MTIHDSYFDLCRKHIIKKDRDIVLLQVGSFYEAYSSPNGEGCAELLSEILNIHLTRKNTKCNFSEKNPKMAGLPIINLERHLNILLDNNYRVFIYQQSEDNPKDRFYRGCFTNNIRMDFESETSLYVKREKKIYSLYLEKFMINRNNIKLIQYKLSFAFLELNTAKMYFSEVIDDNFIRMTEQFFLQHNPDEILFYINEEFSQEEKDDIKNIYDFDFELIEYDNKKINFDEMEQIMNESFSKPPHNLHYYPESMMNMCHIIKHIRKYDPIQSKNLICDDNPWLMIKEKSIMNFNRDLYKELFIFDLKDERSVDSKKKLRSIFDMFSHGMNCMAKRKLARILNTPLTSVEEIEKRYNFIENASIENKHIFSHLIDLESFSLKWQRFSLNEKMVAKCLLVYKSLANIYPMTIDPMMKYIDSIWDLEKMQEGGEYFKNPSEKYKEWCEKYDNILDKFYTFQKENDSFSFVENNQDSYFSILTTKWNKLSSEKKDEFRIISSKNTIKHVMLKIFDSELFLLTAFQRKIKTYQKESFIQHSKDFFTKFGTSIISINETITNDSMYSVLKDFFTKNSYSKPVIIQNDNSFYRIENVRHPLLEKLYSDEVFVPFSSHLDSSHVNGNLIYGLNRSGKSTFMKSIATSIYLAQCGLYTPCSKLEYFPYLSMYSKLNHSDNLFKKQSLFFNEIFELKYILERIEAKRSLILLDELFQGTEIPSTVGLLLGLVDSFVKKEIQFVLSTHIHLISEIIENKYKQRIRISHFKMKDIDLLQTNHLVTDCANIFYDREIIEGSGDASYGIEIAEKLKLPLDIIEIAKHHRKYVHLEYDFEPNKKSKYHKDIIMKQCLLCNSRSNLEVHHIFQQKYFQDKANINGFEKNMKANLIVLCRKCHQITESSSSSTGNDLKEIV